MQTRTPRKRNHACVSSIETPAHPTASSTGPQFCADQVGLWTVDDSAAGQRIDNFLLRLAKGVPKSHVYRILRSGEVRVNKARIDANYRLALGDIVRIPPLRIAKSDEVIPTHIPDAAFEILFEDEYLLAINKPAGIAVHGGSGVAFGVIEQLRRTRPQARFLELVHRLDRETSGVLLIAKKRSALVHLHEQMREGKTDKRYFAAVSGAWKEQRRHVKAPLFKYVTAEGERRVRVQADGQASHTVFTRQNTFHRGDAALTLLEAELKTGRTHQIRVHLAHIDSPILGDEKYGDFTLNRQLQKGEGWPQLRRMFLHAHSLRCQHPHTGHELHIQAPMPSECALFLDAFKS